MSAAIAPERSAQEQALLDGKRVLHGTATDRVLRMLDPIRTFGPPRMALERAVYFTESFKTTEGQPLVLRWAKALHNIAEKIPWPSSSRSERSPAPVGQKWEVQPSGGERTSRISRQRKFQTA